MILLTFRQTNKRQKHNLFVGGNYIHACTFPFRAQTIVRQSVRCIFRSSWAVLAKTIQKFVTNYLHIQFQYSS